VIVVVVVKGVKNVENEEMSNGDIERQCNGGTEEGREDGTEEGIQSPIYWKGSLDACTRLLGSVIRERVHTQGVVLPSLLSWPSPSTSPLCVEQRLLPYCLFLFIPHSFFQTRTTTNTHLHAYAQAREYVHAATQ